MIQISISGANPAELLVAANNVVALLSGASAKATTILSASDQARLRGDATVVPPTETKEPTAAEKKAAKEAEKAAKEAAKKAAAEAEAKAAAKAEAEALGEDGDEGKAEALTHGDVKELLIAVRNAYPKETTIIKQIVEEHGKVGKISDVDEANLPAVAAHCRALLAKAGK